MSMLQAHVKQFIQEPAVEAYLDKGKAVSLF
jgi:hypothetical protein